MTNQFDLNKFNSFLDSATKKITCNSNCQRNRASKRLKNRYLTAETNLMKLKTNIKIVILNLLLRYFK